jgi:uncharacterized protein YutE (UPF0331/DUF86 family)
MNKLHNMIKIADIHAARIKMAVTGLQNFFPLTTGKIPNLSDNEIMLIELLISRFAKLQDYLGRIIIDEFLKKTGDYSDDLTMIDKLHKLERLKIIESADVWENMRRTRNHISHEYPDAPALTAKYLNQIFTLTPKLLNILEKIKEK